MQSGHIVKRYSEVPKNDNFDPKSHFSIEVLPIAHFNYTSTSRITATTTTATLSTLQLPSTTVTTFKCHWYNYNSNCNNYFNYTTTATATTAATTTTSATSATLQLHFNYHFNFNYNYTTTTTRSTTTTITATLHLQLQLQLQLQLTLELLHTLQLQLQLQLQLLQLLQLLQVLQNKASTTSTAFQLHYNYNYNYDYNITTSTTSTPLQLQLQLLHYTTLHPGAVSEVTTATIATAPKKHSSNHLSVHQRIRSAIHASQQLTSPILSYPWNFRHRLVQHYWQPNSILCNIAAAPASQRFLQCIATDLRFKCERPVSLGMNIDSLTKILKMTGTNDSLKIRYQNDADTVNFQCEGSDDRLADFDLKLMTIESEHMEIPEQHYKVVARIPSAEFQKICRDLKEFGETIQISGSKEAWSSWFKAISAVVTSFWSLAKERNPRKRSPLQFMSPWPPPSPFATSWISPRTPKTA